MCSAEGRVAIVVAQNEDCSEADITRTSNTAAVLDVAGTYEGTNVNIIGDNQTGIVLRSTGDVTLTGGSLQTQGNWTFGADLRNGGGSLSLRDYSVETQGDDADALTIDGAVLVELDTVAITTQGARSSGIEAYGGTTVTGANVTIKTGLVAQDDTEAIRIDSGSTVTLNNLDIEVLGTNSIGISVLDGEFSGQTVSIWVDTTPVTKVAAGLHVESDGKATIGGGDISANGQGAHAVQSYGGIVHLDNVDVSATGTAASAIYVSNLALDLGELEVSGGRLSAVDAPLIMAEGEWGSVTLKGPISFSPATIAGREKFVQIKDLDYGGNVYHSDLTFKLDGVTTARGDIEIDGAENSVTLDMNQFTGSFTSSVWAGNLLAKNGNIAKLLLDASTWTGAAGNANQIVLNSTSIWNITDTSNSAEVDNAGTIAFDPAAVGYPTLTTVEYTGGNGTLKFNTWLGADASPTNKLIINGVFATGSTSVLVNNTGGPGAKTTGDGIQLVETINNATTTANAFTLGARVVSGAYEYLLFRGGSGSADDWFLRSHLIPTNTDPDDPVEPEEPKEPEEPAEPEDPVDQPEQLLDPVYDPEVPTDDPEIPVEEPSDPEVPILRPEVPLYMSLSGAARRMGIMTLGTLHERMGEQSNLLRRPGQTGVADAVWARVIAQSGTSSWQGPINLKMGSTVLVGLQAGMDLYRADHENGHRDHFGVYGAYTNQTALIEGFALGQNQLVAGRMALNGQAIGGYWTHYGPTGGYVDTVLQLDFFNATGLSDYGTGLSTSGRGFTASVETGYPFDLGHGVTLEPQAQLIYQSLAIQEGRDAHSTVSFSPAQAVTGRLGLRLQPARPRTARCCSPMPRPISGTIFLAPISPALASIRSVRILVGPRSNWVWASLPKLTTE